MYDPVKNKERMRKKYLRLKADIRAHYGDTCVCPGCGINQEEVLEYHHIETDKTRPHGRQASAGSMEYWRIRKLGYPPGGSTVFVCKLSRVNHPGRVLRFA